MRASIGVERTDRHPSNGRFICQSSLDARTEIIQRNNALCHRVVPRAVPQASGDNAGQSATDDPGESYIRRRPIAGGFSIRGESRNAGRGAKIWALKNDPDEPAIPTLVHRPEIPLSLRQVPLPQSTSRSADRPLELLRVFGQSLRLPFETEPCSARVSSFAVRRFVGTPRNRIIRIARP